MGARVFVEFIHELGDGGASALVKDYAISLKKLGYKVYILVVFPAPDANTYKTLVSNGIEIISVFSNRTLFNRVKNKFLAKYFISNCIKDIILRLKPSVIHAHLTVLKYILPVGSLLHNVKLIYTCHSVPSVYFLGNNLSELSAAQELIKNYDLRIIALHDDMANDINKLFGLNIATRINNGVDFSRFKSITVTKEEVREKLGIPKDSYVIGHIGRFEKVKNHIFLLDVFKKILYKKENSFLLLIGSGSLLNVIQSRINELKLNKNVMILSHRTDVPELLRSMDVFVQPSLYEGFPLATIEAEIMDLPCVVSDNLPKQVYLSPKLKALSLNESLEVWANSIINPSIDNDYKKNICDYDLSNVMKKIEAMYLE